MILSENKKKFGKNFFSKNLEKCFIIPLTNLTAYPQQVILTGDSSTKGGDIIQIEASSTNEGKLY